MTQSHFSSFPQRLHSSAIVSCCPTDLLDHNPPSLLPYMTPCTCFWLWKTQLLLAVIFNGTKRFESGFLPSVSSFHVSSSPNKYPPLKSLEPLLLEGVHHIGDSRSVSAIERRSYCS